MALREVVQRVADLVRAVGRVPDDPVARADGQPCAVAGDDVERHDVVGGTSPRHGVRAARVVAEHPAERAAAVGGGIGPEGEPVPGGGGAERVEDDTGLHARDAAFGVDLQDTVQVAAVVEDDALAERLPADAGARTARRHRDTVRAGDAQGGRDVLGAAREHDDLRDVPVVRRVHAEHRPGGGTVVHLARHGAGQVFGEGGHGGHQFWRDSVSTVSRSVSRTSRGATASRRCCFSAPSTSAGTSETS